MNLDINFLFRVITFLKIFFIGRLSIYWQVLLMSIKCLQTLWSPLHLFISSSDWEWECHQFCWPVLLFPHHYNYVRNIFNCQYSHSVLWNLSLSYQTRIYLHYYSLVQRSGGHTSRSRSWYWWWYWGWSTHSRQLMHFIFHLGDWWFDLVEAWRCWLVANYHNNRIKCNLFLWRRMNCKSFH